VLYFRNLHLYTVDVNLIYSVIWQLYSK